MDIKEALTYADVWKESAEIKGTISGNVLISTFNVLSALITEVHSLRAQLPKPVDIKRQAIVEFLLWDVDISELPAHQFDQVVDACFEALENTPSCTGVVYDIRSGFGSQDYRCYTLHSVRLSKEANPDITIQQLCAL